MVFLRKNIYNQVLLKSKLVLYCIYHSDGKISRGGLTFMFMDFVWNVFNATGSVDSYVLIKEIEAKYKSEKTEDVIQEGNFNLIR